MPPNPTININKIPVQEPQMKDLLDLFKKDILFSLNCHAVATIQGIDPSTKKVQATLNYSRTFLEKDPTSGLYVEVLKDYPILVDVPYMVICGGTASLNLPITTGDQCLLLFHDRDLDNYLAGARSGAVASQRAHSLSDAIALVGLNNSSENYDPNRASLNNGPTKVGVSLTKVLITNGTTLNTLLQQLITDIKAITTTNTVPGSPAALSAASILALTNDATAIGQLLE